MDIAASTTLPQPPTVTDTRWPRREGSLHNPTAIATAVSTLPKNALSKDATQWPRKVSPMSHGNNAAGGVRTTTRKRADSRTDAKTTTHMLPTITTAPKPIVPVTKRRSHDDEKSIKAPTKKDVDAEKWEITPDGGSAGREGRQFTVSNVGNNGRIYLRPTVRPANQRYPQPNFVFPITPPGTAGFDALTEQKPKTVPPSSDWDDSQQSRTPLASPRRIKHSTKSPASQHRRVQSDCTLHETDAGAFKIVISKPGGGPRSKTVEDLDGDEPFLLDVNIPSWRIGTPKFTRRGTVIFQGSSYAPSEDLSSSSASRSIRTSPCMATSSIAIPASPISPTRKQRRITRFTLPVDPHESIRPLSARFPPYTPPTSSSNIRPDLFDAPKLQPECDDREVVRYSPATGTVIAASPPRLIAEITSPSFVDYELLSDFFLTYRAFMGAPDLARLLLARWRWALRRQDQVGTVCRVRTFVALRHWILNYFLDDFVTDYDLRVEFCLLLNDVVNDLSQDPPKRSVQLKILAELKKCWRRVCSQFWDGPDFDESLGPFAPIMPGGIAGHRDPALDPSFWEQLSGPPQLEDMFPPPPNADSSFYADISKAAHSAMATDNVILEEARPSTPDTITNKTKNDSQHENLEGQGSPTSLVSVEAISCSFPSKFTRGHRTAAVHPVTEIPANVTSVPTSTGPVAPTPRTLVGKRVRPNHNHNHKRNPSYSDSIRDNRGEKASVLDNQQQQQQQPLTIPFPGSLVRGDLLPPSEAYVDLGPPSTASDLMRHTTLFQPGQEFVQDREKLSGSAMSSQGMMKLIGSVRRVLGQKNSTTTEAPSHFMAISSLGLPQGATTNRLPGTAIVPQPRYGQSRRPIRIDVLGAEVAEDFSKAVQEDAAIDQIISNTIPEEQAVQLEESLYSPIEQRILHHPHPPSVAQPMESTLDLGLGLSLGLDATMPRARAVSDAAITNGSKSIVIVDDTEPIDRSAIDTATSSAALQYVETFGGDAYGAGPTPPMTPPDDVLKTPRQQSIISSLYEKRRPNTSAGSLPSFLDLQRTTRSFGAARPATALMDAVSFDFRQSQLSDQSNSSFLFDNSHDSFSRTRGSFVQYASFQSAFGPQHQSVRSFDESMQSYESDLDNDEGVNDDDIDGDDDDEENDENAIPQPLRMLRRKPGGNLRAAKKIGDLDYTMLRRSKSVGSLTTFSESFRSSSLRSPHYNSSGFVVGVVNSDYSNDRADVMSLGALTAQTPKRVPSLFSTHSSKPVMRPSFEAEARNLAQIPDDTDDEGGVASALAKLEGKYEKKVFKLSMEPRKGGPPPTHPPPPPPPPPTSAPTQAPAQHITFAGGDLPTRRKERKQNRNLHIRKEDLESLRFRKQHTPKNSQGSSIKTMHVDVRSETIDSLLLEDLKTDSFAAAQTPTAHYHRDRESTQEYEQTGTDKKPRPMVSFLQGASSTYSAPPDRVPPPIPTSQHYSLDSSSAFSLDQSSVASEIEVVKKYLRESMEDKPADVANNDRDPDNGDDGDTGSLSSELSSELSTDIPEIDDLPGWQAEKVESGERIYAFVPEPLSCRTEGLTQGGHPPSPPMTLDQRRRFSPTSPTLLNTNAAQDAKQRSASQPQLQSINTSPLARGQFPDSPQSAVWAPTSFGQLSPLPHPLASNTAAQYASHLPFILAFGSEVLAQQFTLIEKDALNEIDWRELIELSWNKNANSEIRSWVDFLRNTDARGVEVVIARFNIMVKWAISEIILTQDIEERARCITKFIHIAAHCRRFRNFATVTQITLALSSKEISGLHKTWQMVPALEVQILRDLEQLVSPTRNFYSLRAEMEAGSKTGCVPFVCVYTHDLLFNAQRPSEIASSPSTLPLVNFERYRCAATVVKTLLRLLEASTLYDFQPIEGITERCLWICSLRDEDIRKHASALE